MENSKKYFECITCSVGCSDFLKIFLEKNSKHFDNIIVVTSPTDPESIEISKKSGARTLITDFFYRNKNKFDRGGAYNRALDFLKFNHWVSFIDVDIILDDSHSEYLKQYSPFDDIFYGMDRLNITNENQRNSFLKGKDFKCNLNCKYEWGFGYFQLFSMKHPLILKKIGKSEAIYPSANDVGLSDFLFRMQFGFGGMDKMRRWHWDSSCQRKLPWPCFHLGSDGVGLKSKTIKYE